MTSHAPLLSPPSTLPATRVALHRLAAYVVAPLRYRHTERFGLRATPGGFGTPIFGDERRVRVVGLELIDEVGDTARRSPITTLAAAAAFLETEIDAETAAEHDTPAAGDVQADLGIDEAASDYLGRWFEAAFAALRQVADDEASVDASEPQLWPGHFDPAIEIGDENHRGSYGASPGDDFIDEPYLYVSIWWPDRLGIAADDPNWATGSFSGAVLKASDFADADPVATAVEFWRSTRERLAQHST